MLIASANDSVNHPTYNNVTLNWTYTGFNENISIYSGLELQFNATLYNKTSTSYFTNETVNCYVNLSNESKPMTFSSPNNLFYLNYKFTESYYSRNYSIICNNSDFSINSNVTEFSVYNETVPVLPEKYNNTVTKYYQDVPQNVYIVLLNLSNNSKFLEADYCILELDETEKFNLSTKEINNNEYIFSNNSVAFSNVGIQEVNLSCHYNGKDYDWKDEIEILEYASEFDSQYTFGDASTGVLNLIFKENNLYSIHSGNNYSTFEYFNSNFENTYENKDSNINGNSIISLITSNYLLNLVDNSNDVGRIHHKLNQNNYSTLSNTIFGGLAHPFLTSFDTNNDGTFETLTFFEDSNSNLKGFVIYNATNFSENGLPQYMDGSVCYEDFDNDGLLDILVSGSETSAYSKNSSIFLNKENNFESEKVLDLGKFWGSCHISKFLENNETNILMTGVERVSSPLYNLYLFNNYSDLLEGKLRNIAPDRFPYPLNESGLYDSDIFIADMDNDGLKDIILCGTNQAGNSKTYYLKQNYTNHGHFYIQQENTFPNVGKCSITATHLDDNSGLDIAIGGVGGDNKIKVYFNNPPRFVANPDAPEITNLSYNENDKTLYIEWSETNPMHSYNLRVKYRDNDTYIMDGFYPLSTHPSQGYLGNMRYRTNFTLRGIEGNFTTSDFIAEIQSFDVALRKSEWGQLICEPNSSKSEWNISSYCPITNTSFSKDYNITINEGGRLDLLNSFVGNQTNITINGGELRGSNIEVNKIIYNSTYDLSNLNLTTDLIVKSNISITDSTIYNLTTDANVSLYDTNTTISLTNKRVLGNGQINNHITSAFIYKDQWNNTITGVSQNISGTSSTNTSFIELKERITSSSTQVIEYTVNFTKHLYKDTIKTFNLTPLIEIQLNRTKTAIIDGFDSNLSSNFSEIPDSEFENFENLTVGINNKGQIKWNVPANISYLNLSKWITIDDNLVTVNITAKSSGLNVSANVTLFNLSYNVTPIVLRNGVYCEDCSILSYDGENVTFSVNGFSTYTTNENAELSYHSSSLIIANEDYEFKVKYVNLTNNEIIQDADCSVELSNGTHSKYFNLTLNNSYYSNITSSSEAPEGDNLNLTVSCNATGYEPLMLKEELRVLEEGRFFLLKESFEDLEISSAGMFGSDLYYNGLDNFRLKEFKNNLEDNYDDLDDRILHPFSLADINNDGDIDKVTLNHDAINKDSGNFITSDLDDDGDIDIIYYGEGKLIIKENKFNSNHNTISFITSYELDLSISDYSIDFVVHNNKKLLAVQGALGSQNSSQLLLYQINSTTEVELLDDIDNLKQGEIKFIDINSDNQLELITTGNNYSDGDSNPVIFEVENGILSQSQLSISDNLYHTSISYIQVDTSQHPLILISGIGISGGFTNTINAYQFNGTNLEKNNTIIQDVQPFSKGSAVFGDTDGDFIPELFVTGSATASQLFELYDTDKPTYTQPKIPTIIDAEFNSGNLTIIWDDTNENATYHVKVGDYANKNRFVSGVFGSSTNPTGQQHGNMWEQTNITFKNMPETCFYIEVKAISGSYIHSNWSTAYYETSGKRSETYDVGYPYYDSNCDGKITQKANAGGGLGSSTHVGSSYTPPQETVTDTTEEENTDIIEQVEEVKETILEEPKQESSSKEELISEESFQKITSNTFSHKRKVEEQGGTTRITEILNTKEFDLENLSVRVFIHKTVLRSAKDLNIIDPFVVIEDDPIIEFQEPRVNRYDEIEFSYAINEKDIDTSRILLEITHNNITEEQIDTFNNNINKTKDILNVTKEIQETENETIYNIDIHFDENESILYNVSIFEHIPKCLLEIINEETAESDREFEIIDEDPVIVWHFDELLKGEEIQLKIKAIAGTDCDNEGETIALAREIIAVKDSNEDLNLIPPLLLIAGLLIFFLFVSHYTKEKFHNEHSQILVKKIKRGLRKRYKLPDIKIYLEKHHENKEAIEEAINAVKHPIRQFFIKTAVGLESIILLTLIVLNILDFMKVLPGDIDFIKKIISWILLALVFNHVGISKVLFGRRSGKLDAVLLISFFLLTLKNFIGFAKATFIETEFVRDLYVYVINHNVQFEIITFFAGFIGLISIAVFMAIRKHIRKDSLMGAFFIHHKESKQGVFKRFWQILFIEIVFFLLVFNLMFEWLAIAVDAPILVLVVIMTLVGLIIRKLHRHYKETPMHIVESITEAPDHFYERIIELFHHPKFLPIGIAGMFVLHLITEIGVYLIPYSFGFRDPVYVNILDNLHLPLFSVTGLENWFHISTEGFGLFVSSQYFIGYLLNLLALLFCLVLPIWIWAYELKHKNKPITEISILDAFRKHDSKVLEIIGKVMMIVFPVLFFFMINIPAFDFKSITGGLLAGVNITTQQISLHFFMYILLVALLILIVSFFMSRKDKFNWMGVTLLVSASVVMLYDYLYLKSIITYGTSLISMIVTTNTTWGILKNISLSLTVVLTLISIIGVYIIAPLLLIFMYIPSKNKHRFLVFLPSHIKELQNYHYIHHHHNHDDHIHGDKIKILIEHIENQIELGHELFVIAEHLEEYGWEWADVEKAVKKLSKNKKLKHVNFKFHPEHQTKIAIDKLKRWIIEQYEQRGMKLSKLIDIMKKEGWDEDDIRIALKQIKLKKEDEHLRHFLNTPSLIED